MSNLPLAPLATWLVERLSGEVSQSVERIRSAQDVHYVALMPDIHLAANICVGAVIATEERIYPDAVGSDIGCGMAAVAVDADANLFADPRSAASLLAELRGFVPGNKHPSKRDLPSELVSRPLSDPALSKAAQRDGRVQLGTLGRGNHFLEFQTDWDDRLWIMVHSGSRAMGQLITRHHVRKIAERSQSLPSVQADGDQGQAYLSDIAWARAYAAENRLSMLHAIDRVLDGLFATAIDWSTLIHSDHNHVQREQHFGRLLWVHRKGAQSSRNDEAVVIPGSMGTSSYHAVGRGVETSLTSCSHGAGRRLSRTDAARRISVRELDRQMHGVWFDHRHAPALRDEAPAAYKDIRQVMRAQRELVRITRELKPILSYKGV